MTAAASQYAKFREEVARKGRVFTFLDEGHYLTFPMGGHEVIPFWSSRTRMEKIQKQQPGYRKFTIREIELAEFLSWLQKPEKDGIRIGPNWSGTRLTGYDVEAGDLGKGIQYWLDRPHDQ